MQPQGAHTVGWEGLWISSELSCISLLPQGAWGGAGAELAAPSAVGEFPPPLASGLGTLREQDTQTKESLHFKELGLQRCFKTKMCSGFRHGGRALTLLCS